MKEELMKVVTSLVEGDTDTAEVALADYLKNKTRSVLEMSFAHDMDSDEFEEELDHDTDDEHEEEEEVEDINRQVEEYRKRLMKDRHQDSSSRRKPMRRNRRMSGPSGNPFSVRMEGVEED